MTTARVIGRRRPGREIPEVVADVQERLRAEGWSVEATVVSHKRELRKAAREGVKDDIDVLVAVGGDGTIREIATGMDGSTTSLGVIPTGTGNLFAGNLGIPTDRSEAVRTMTTGRRRRIDLGRIRVDGKRRAFTVACGIGFDAKVMDATDASQKLHWGRAAYLANAVGQAGALHPVPHVIVIDGVRHEMEATQVVIANFGKMLPIVQPRRRIRSDDGQLDVIVIRATGAIPALLAGWEALTQVDLGESDSGRLFRSRARKVRIETDPARLVEADGSVIGPTPVSVSIRPDALTVLVPRD